MLEPGKLGSLYHAEQAQEDFLVLSGSCLLLIDGEENPPSKLAQRHGAGVEDETSLVEEAYGERRRKPIPYGGWLD